jgi:hypothetical protein
MNTRFTNGRHNYLGKFNSRSQRMQSKIYKGINTKELESILTQLSQEYGLQSSSKLVSVDGRN